MSTAYYEGRKRTVKKSATRLLSTKQNNKQARRKGCHASISSTCTIYVRMFRSRAVSSSSHHHHLTRERFSSSPKTLNDRATEGTHRQAKFHKQPAAIIQTGSSSNITEIGRARGDTTLCLMVQKGAAVSDSFFCLVSALSIYTQHSVPQLTASRRCFISHTSDHTPKLTSSTICCNSSSPV